VIFLAELNGLTLFQADVGNAYLEAKTKEKVYFIVDAGFGAHEGHTLLIVKALYGTTGRVGGAIMAPYMTHTTNRLFTPIHPPTENHYYQQ